MSTTPSRRRPRGRTANAPAASFDPSDWPIAWMARAERQHARNATALLAPLGLHHREFRLLALLGTAEGRPLGELAELAVLERPTVSKMVDRLQAEGWVQRSGEAADRRRSLLSLTPAGRTRLAMAVPIVEGLFRRYQQGLDPARAAAFVAELKDFHQRVKAAGASDPTDD